MRKKSILLDIHGTIIIGMEFHYLLPELLIKLRQYDVTIWSDEPDIKRYAKLFNFKCVSKSEDITPEADILIDDLAELFINKAYKVKKYYTRIEDFLRSA